MDYYIENPEKLNGQPKRTIADYVEQNGILVPKRYDSLKEARKSHKPILLRSEHPQDYGGASGLMDSFRLSGLLLHGGKKKFGNIKFMPREMGSEEEIKEAYFEFKDQCAGTPMYEQYCDFLGLNKDEFKKDVSFSVWEYLGGLNRTVVADSAIGGIYHIMTNYYKGKGKYLFNYSIVENGKLSKEFVSSLPIELKDVLPNLIESYESVRNLDNFDKNHCPIMEFQTCNGKNYFLQYHRTRDFEPSQFILDENGEKEVPFVRGATSKDGMDCKITVYYSGSETWNFDPDNEDGSYDLHYNLFFSEIRARQRKVQMINSEKLEWELMKFVVDHLQKSKLFKPKISIIHNINDVLNGETTDDFYEMTKSGKNSYLDLHIVSDGRRAFVKRI